MKKNLLSILIIVLNIFICQLIYAAPDEVIIIRHADKLDQTEPGPTLSAKGEVRAINFAFYFRNMFGNPDYIIAADPESLTGKNSSIRELQTVAPLANIIASEHPNVDVPILHPYKSSDYAKLADYILHDAQFDKKIILICWNHKKIPELAQELGVMTNLDSWPKDDFDSVYILKYNSKGEVSKFNILNKQYPISDNPTWGDLYKEIK